MGMVTKIILAIFGSIIGAIVIGLTLSFVIGPIDTSHSNVPETLAEISDTLFNQPEESEESAEAESEDADTELEYDSEDDEENSVRNLVRTRVANITTPGSSTTQIDDYESTEENDEEVEETAPPHPIVGSWEITNTVEVDTETIGTIAETKRFFEDGTGIKFHSESPQMRDFNWRIEDNLLTITPADTSVRITTHNFEISGDTLTIFHNRNRTSYVEAQRI